MSGELSLLRVAELVRAEGVAAFVAQTGGGVATLYAGDPVGVDSEGFEQFPAVAGPGSFWPSPTFCPGELCVGPDTEGWNVADVDFWESSEGSTVEDVAREILSRVRGVSGV